MIWFLMLGPRVSEILFLEKKASLVANFVFMHYSLQIECCLRHF